MKSRRQQFAKRRAEIFLVIAVGLAGFNPSSAVAAQMEDGQDYPAATSTPGTGRSPWLMANSGASAGSTSFIGIYANDLTGTTTPPLAGLTNIVNPLAHLQISRATANSRTYYRSIGASATNGSVYFSFLMNVATNPTTSDEIMGALFPAVPGGSFPANPSTNDPITLHARQGADATHFNLGIQSLGGATSWLTNQLADATDYLIVLQFTFGAGQPGRLFLNPVPGAAQPVANTNATKGSVSEPANIGTVLFWESSTSTSGTFNYDVMRVDTNWANVTPATNNLPGSPTPMRVLFLGNSLLGISASYSNNIPAILSDLTANLGDAFAYSRIANSGWLLADHTTNAASTNLINSGNFDLVVLQEKSETPSLPPDRDSLMFPACRTLNTMITNHSERTMFYETWGQINGDPNSNCNSYDIPAQYKTCNYPSFASFTAMNIAIRKAYASISTELAAPISPVGLAWARVRTEQPGLNIYILDDSTGDRHPNSLGAYLAACVFYGAIFGRSPEGSTYYSTNNVSDAQYLQRIAAETVLDDPFATDAYGFGPNRFQWAYNWLNYTNPPGAPTNTVLISGASATPSPSVKLDSNAGSVGNLSLGVFDASYAKPGQGRFFLATNGSLVVTGAMIVGKEGAGFVRQSGGTLVVNGALTLGEQSGGLGQYTLSNGVLRAAQILNGAGSGSFRFRGGSLTFTQFGSGPRPLDLSAEAGTLTLTNTAGLARLFGNFTNGSAATLAITLGSVTNALEVSGIASLSGTLRLNYAPGFTPAPGQQFNLVTTAARAGDFSQIILPAVTAAGLGLSTSLTATSVVASVISYVPALAVTGIATSLFTFTVNGVAGQNYVVQANTNLAAGNWIPVLTNPAPILFTETNRSLTQRFYRAIYLP